VQGGQVLLLLLLWGGFRLRGCSSFGARTSLLFPLSLLLVLRLGGSLNKTKMGFTVHVLMARRAVHIVASMFFKGLGSYFLLQTVRTATATKAHGGL